jgi:membrane AbrB-like protein
VSAPSLAQWRQGALGLAVGVLAGGLFSGAGAPIPWMLGPLIGVAALRIAGKPVGAPPGGRQIGQWVIGTALGLYFTPAVVREVADSWWLLALGAAFAIGLGYLGGLILSRLGGVDRTTAVFASVPGGAAEMWVLAERFGARGDRVAAAQSLRIMIVVIVIPFAYAALGLHGADVYVQGATSFDAAGVVLLLSATLAGSLAVQALRIPNAFVLGSLAASIPLTALGVDLSTVPAVATNAAQCLLGCALGSRFEPEFLRGAHRFVAAVIVSVSVAIAASTLVAILLALATRQHPATVVLGMAPGGIAEMCITAKVLQLGVPLVTAFHVTRLAVLLVATAPIFERMRAWRRARARAGERG